MNLSRDQVLDICKEVCPNCAAELPLRQRADTREWVHDNVRGSGVSHAFCLAHHLRTKHQDILNG